MRLRFSQLHMNARCLHKSHVFQTHQWKIFYSEKEFHSYDTWQKSLFRCIKFRGDFHRQGYPTTILSGAADRVDSRMRNPRDARKEWMSMRTLHNCCPGERSSKGCLEKHREHAKSACTLFALILGGFPVIGGYDWIYRTTGQRRETAVEETRYRRRREKRRRRHDVRYARRGTRKREGM